MSKRLTTQEFIEKSTKVHLDKYDYSKVVYIDNRTKVIICCLIHGEFLQIPQHHSNGHGCVKCSGENIRKKLSHSKEKFVEKATKVHGEKYCYKNSNYINDSTKVKIICSAHEEFVQKANSHLNGRGCWKCANKKTAERRENSTENFIKEVATVHNNRYDYSKVEYKGALEKITIICKTHGEFKQKATYHKQGNGCSLCADENRGCKKSMYIKQARERLCELYILKCFNEEEEFYKIGITMNSIKKRYKNSRDMPYKYLIISEIFGGAEEIWDLEKKVIIENKIFKYQPIKFFKGKGECFTKELPILKIIKNLNNN